MQLLGAAVPAPTARSQMLQHQRGRAARCSQRSPSILGEAVQCNSEAQPQQEAARQVPAAATTAAATSSNANGSSSSMESHLFRMPSLPMAADARPPGTPSDAADAAAAEQLEQLPWEPSLVVFSGGTAFNSVAGHMRQLTTHIAHVLPVSDDGGSTAEIVRVLGGPAVGDIRSRCLRLADDSDEEARAVRQLLAHRLNDRDSGAAKQEWYSIVEGEDPLWEGISDAYKHIIRSFLVHFHANIMRHSTKRFDYHGGSVGNFFFAGARIFFRSLEAAIFLFSRVARIPVGSLVLPVILTEEHITLGAELLDGSLIVGQNQISHPSSTDSPHEVDKSCEQRLEAPVKRIFYLSAEGDTHEHEVAPTPNPRVLTELERADAIVYGMGSLYTSIAPSLILKGVGECIAAATVPKIFLLNGASDRESSCCPSHDGPMTAADMVQATADALNRRASKRTHRLGFPPSAFVTAVLIPVGSPIVVDRSALERLGVQQILEVPSAPSPDGRGVLYDPNALVAAVATVVATHQQQLQATQQAALGVAGGGTAAAATQLYLMVQPGGAGQRGSTCGS